MTVTQKSKQEKNFSPLDMWVGHGAISQPGGLHLFDLLHGNRRNLIHSLSLESTDFIVDAKQEAYSQVIIRKHKFHIHFISQFSNQLHLFVSVSVLCLDMTRQMAGILKKVSPLPRLYLKECCRKQVYVKGSLKVQWLVSQKKDFTQPQRLRIFTWLYSEVEKILLPTTAQLLSKSHQSQILDPLPIQ
jgi:hypothetical protein